MSGVTPKVGALVAMTVVVLVGCSPRATSSSPTEPTKATVASPTADLAHPVGIVAIGHSGLTGEGTGARLEAVPGKSWATGSDPQVNSIYLRMVALQPSTEGHVANTAVGGAPASALTSQAKQALDAVPAPALVIIQTVDNDIMCNGSNVAQVGQALNDALMLIHDRSPNTKILVAGQLGRPSVAFITQLVAHDPATKDDLTFDDPCSFFDTGGKLRPVGVAKLSAVIDMYEAETARVCAAVANCVTDGGVRKAYIDTIENFSPDYAHLNVKGQTAEAALIWPVVEALLKS
jgi:hypothetical protein